MPGAEPSGTSVTSGLLANRPAANAGIAIYIATDSGQAFWTDGANWHQLGANDLPIAMTAGLYYMPSGQGNSATSAAGQGNLRVAPMQIPRDVTLQRIGGEITTAGDAGSVLRLGIYADNGFGYPGALLIDAGTIPGDIVQAAEIIINRATPAGSYWIGGVNQLCPVTAPTYRSVGTGGQTVPIGQAAMPAAGSTISALLAAGVFGALPDPFPAGATGTNGAPRLFYKGV